MINLLHIPMQHGVLCGYTCDSPLYAHCPDNAGHVGQWLLIRDVYSVYSGVYMRLYYLQEADAAVYSRALQLEYMRDQPFLGDHPWISLRV